MLSDALHATITMLRDELHYVVTLYLKMKEECEIPRIIVNLIDDDFGIVLELSLLTFNMKRRCWSFFYSFLRKYDAKNPLTFYF